MSNELQVYEGSRAVVEAKRGNYVITAPISGQQVELKRDIDFGKIPKTKVPTLFKSGAEKIVLNYGLLQHYTIESKIEQTGDNPLFLYVVRCDLVKVGNNGQEYVFATGYGSANTSESRCGFAGVYNSVNNCIKMASKRALVMASISIAGISDCFSQDLENETFVEGGYKDIAGTQDPNAKITAKQVKRLFAIANENGFNANEAKNKLASMGYTKASDVTQEKYDEVCKSFEEAEAKK